MKKSLCIGSRLGAGLIVFLGLMAAVGLDEVDYHPYVREEYYTRTADQLRALTATNRLIEGELLAGFGRACLTPTLAAPQDAPVQGQFRQLPLAGYGNRHGKPATGVHDDLYVKAVAVRVGSCVGVLVGTDALIVPLEVSDAAAEQLSREFNLSRDQLYLSATHSHSSLGGWGEGVVAEGFAGPFKAGVRVWFANQIVAAVRQALGDLKPAMFGQGHFTAEKFVRNRLVGKAGKVDPEFTYVFLKREDGKTAVLGSYSAHATVLSGEMMEFSADYPGCWQRAVEEGTGGLAVFLAGGVGSHAPNPPGKGFAGAQQMGQALATAVMDELPRTALTNHIIFGKLAVELAMPPLNVRLTDSIRLRPWLAHRIVHPSQHNWIQAFRLGDLIWISTPCDFSGEMVLGIKDSLRARGKDAVVTSFNGSYIGYVIPMRYYHLPGYEPRLMSFFGPNVPDYLDEIMRTVALSLAEAPTGL